MHVQDCKQRSPAEAPNTFDSQENPPYSRQSDPPTPGNRGVLLPAIGPPYSRQSGGPTTDGDLLFLVGKPGPLLPAIGGSYSRQSGGPTTDGFLLFWVDQRTAQHNTAKRLKKT